MSHKNEKDNFAGARRRGDRSLNFCRNLLAYKQEILYICLQNNYIMGTRADFYLRKEQQMLYLGSIAWDGYEIDEVETASSESDYLEKVKNFIASRRDGSLPERDGWPWPWKNSKLTDEICVFNVKDNAIYRGWKDTGVYDDASTPYLFYKGWDQQGVDDNYEEVDIPNAVSWLMPDMSEVQNITYGSRSGLIVFNF